MLASAEIWTCCSTSCANWAKSATAALLTLLVSLQALPATVGGCSIPHRNSFKPACVCCQQNRVAAGLPVLVDLSVQTDSRALKQPDAPNHLPAAAHATLQSSGQQRIPAMQVPCVQITDLVTAKRVCMLLNCGALDMLDHCKSLPRVMPVWTHRAPRCGRPLPY